MEFQDRVMNIGASLVKQVANATNDVAGDGEVFIHEILQILLVNKTIWASF